MTYEELVQEINLFLIQDSDTENYFEAKDIGLTLEDLKNFQSKGLMSEFEFTGEDAIFRMFDIVQYPGFAIVWRA